jgi:hypothetical protein
MSIQSDRDLPGSFNLLSNPFVILRVNPATSNEGVSYAFEDRLSDSQISETDLNEMSHPSR